MTKCIDGDAAACRKYLKRVIDDGNPGAPGQGTSGTANAIAEELMLLSDGVSQEAKDTLCTLGRLRGTPQSNCEPPEAEPWVKTDTAEPLQGPGGVPEPDQTTILMPSGDSPWILTVDGKTYQGVLHQATGNL